MKNGAPHHTVFLLELDINGVCNCLLYLLFSNNKKIAKLLHFQTCLLKSYFVVVFALVIKWFECSTVVFSCVFTVTIIAVKTSS